METGWIHEVAYVGETPIARSAVEELYRQLDELVRPLLMDYSSGVWDYLDNGALDPLPGPFLSTT